MFIGHFGAGFTARKIAPQLSLGTLFFAAQFIDLIWPVFLLLGIERVEVDPGNTVVTPLHFVHYPFSHSLFAVLVWALLIGVGYYLLKKRKIASLVLGGLVISHWVLDLLTHRPDLPVVPWSSVSVGFGLWNSLWATILVEGLIFIGGVYLYVKTTRPRNRKGSIGLWALVLFLLVIYFGNLFGPPPPSAEPIGILGLAQWLFVPWAFWVDRNREYQ